MKVIVNTDHGIHGTRARSGWARAVVSDELKHLGNHLTRIEMHLGADSGVAKSPPDIRCMLEARIEGRRPVAVTLHERSLDRAVRGAARKLHHLVEHAIERAQSRAFTQRTGAGDRKERS